MSVNEIDEAEQELYDQEMELVEAGILDADQVSLPQEATEADLAWLPTEKQD